MTTYLIEDIDTLLDALLDGLGNPAPGLASETDGLVYRDAQDILHTGEALGLPGVLRTAQEAATLRVLERLLPYHSLDTTEADLDGEPLATRVSPSLTNTGITIIDPATAALPVGWPGLVATARYARYRPGLVVIDLQR